MDELRRAMTDVFLAWTEEYGSGINLKMDDLAALLTVVTETASAAVAEEREACAALAKKFTELRGTGDLGPMSAIMRQTAQMIADRIRARGAASAEEGE